MFLCEMPTDGKEARGSECARGSNPDCTVGVRALEEGKVTSVVDDSIKRMQFPIRHDR